jgi:hypothetical protein
VPTPYALNLRTTQTINAMTSSEPVTTSTIAMSMLSS